MNEAEERMVKAHLDKMVDQVVQALGRLAFKGIEVEMVRVMGDLVEPLRERLKGDVSERVNPRLESQRSSIAWFYSPTPAAVNMVKRGHWVGIDRVRSRNAFGKVLRVKPVGILVPSTWSQFAQSMEQERQRQMIEKSYMMNSPINKQLDNHDRRAKR